MEIRKLYSVLSIIRGDIAEGGARIIDRHG